MKSTHTTSAMVKHDKIHVNTKRERINKKDERNPLAIDAHYREHIGRLISKRNLPNVVY